MENLEIGTILYKPCSMDICEYKIKSMIISEAGVSYVAKATHNIGACGRVEVLLYAEKFGNFRFMDCTEDYEYERGLGNFVEGLYYTNKLHARLEFYKIQEDACRQNLDQKERWYKDAKANMEKVDRILKEIREQIKEETQN